jgi:protein-disulfide isomerase
MGKKGRARTGARSVTLGPRSAAAGLILVLAVLAIVVGRTLRAGPRPSTPQTGAATTTGAGAGAGVTPEGDPYRGAASAPVTIVAYSDFLCPNCRQFATEVVPWLEATWMARGFVRLVYRDFAIRGEGSFLAAEAARCAGESGRFWEFHDTLFALPTGERSREELADVASSIGLRREAHLACLETHRHRAAVEAATAAARARGFAGTPTYEINGRRTEGAIPIDRWNDLFVAFQNDLGR